jgi:hypothetical protein
MKSIDSKLKDEINSEGFDCEDEISGSALLIGTREEMPGLKERLYSNGNAIDLRSYIKMHKKIVLPYEEMASINTPNCVINSGRGAIWNKDHEGTFNYVDSEGNIAEFKIELEKIASFWEILKNDREIKDKIFLFNSSDSFIEEIKSLGFDERFLNGDGLSKKFTPLIEEYNKKNNPKKTFDF